MTIELSVEAAVGLAGLAVTAIGYQHAIWRAIAKIDRNTVTHEVCEKRQERCCEHLRDILKSKGIIGLLALTVSVVMIAVGCK